MNSEYSREVEKLSAAFSDAVSNSGAFTREEKSSFNNEISNRVLPLLNAPKPKILVYGIYNGGKSTLVNAICGHEVAEVGNRPTTHETHPEITDHYIAEALNTARDELIHGTCRNIPVPVSNTHWIRAWRNYPHISDFMEHLSPNEQEFSPMKFPVRTLSAYTVEGDKVAGYGVSLSGEEGRAILFADGRRTVKKIAEENGISPAVFESLNNKCLVYFSDF